VRQEEVDSDYLSANFLQRLPFVQRAASCRIVAFSRLLARLTAKEGKAAGRWKWASALRQWLRYLSINESLNQFLKDSTSRRVRVNYLV
jgi:hypothetical protein